MKGDYENIWNDAFEGSSVSPSDKVWQGIESSMDSGNSKRSWVTILLIAATISVAFAFPLTVGNSSYELQPSDFEMTETAPETKNQIAETSSESKINRTEPFEPVSLTDGDNLNSESYQTSSYVKVQVELDQNGSLDSNDGLYQAGITTAKILEPQLLQKEPGSGLDTYYILPAYLRKEKSSNRSLLAFGNINSGRQSATSGFADMNALASSADFEFSNLNGSNYDGASDTRNEDGGTSFYLGLGVEIPMGQRFSLAAGLGYQNQRLNGSSNVIYEENGNQFPLGIYDPIVPGTIFLSENYDYVSNNQLISIPVSAKYAIIDKKIKLRAGLGLSPDFMFAHAINSKEYGSNSFNPSETLYNTVQLSGLASIDVMFPLSSNYGLAVETGLRQGMIPIVSDGSNYTTTFNLGVILFYQLNK